MKNKQNKLLQDDTRIRFTEFGFRLHVVREGVRFSPVHSVTVRAGCNWKNSQAESHFPCPPPFCQSQKNAELAPEKVSSVSTISIRQTFLVCTAHALWVLVHGCAAVLNVIKSRKCTVVKMHGYEVVLTGDHRKLKK